MLRNQIQIGPRSKNQQGVKCSRTLIFGGLLEDMQNSKVGKEPISAYAVSSQSQKVSERGKEFNDVRHPLEKCSFWPSW